MRDNIILGRLDPGEKLTTGQIAKDLNISETPVREGFKRLEALGLVEIYPHKNVIVSNPSPEEIIERLEIRALLQSKAALLSGPNLNNSDIIELEKIHSMMDQYIERNEILKYIDAGYVFHEKIYYKCPNKTLLKMIQDLKSRTIFAKRRFLMSSKIMEWSGSEHSKIISAIKDKKFDLIATIEYDHQMRSIEEFKAVVAKNKAFFDTNGGS